jgi:hypothetical protein
MFCFLSRRSSLQIKVAFVLSMGACFLEWSLEYRCKFKAASFSVKSSFMKTVSLLVILLEVQAFPRSMNQVLQVNASNCLARFVRLIIISFSKDPVFFKPLIIPWPEPSNQNLNFSHFYGRSLQLLGVDLNQEWAYQ